MLRKVINLIKSDAAVFDLITATVKSKEREKLVAEKAKIEKQLKALSAEILKLYEDSASGLLEDEKRHKLIQDYQQEQKTANKRLTVINDELETIKNYEKNIKELKACISTYTTFTELNIDVLDQLIARIEIGYPKRIEKNTIQQEINVIYKFINATLPNI